MFPNFNQLHLDNYIGGVKTVEINKNLRFFLFIFFSIKQI